MKYRRLSKFKIKKILKCFCEDIAATQTAKILGINRNTINNYFEELRQKIFVFTNKKQKFSGELELDESYFGAKRVRGKRGRGAAGKTPVFGILKRDGEVHIEVVKNCSRSELMPIIQGKILDGATIYTDSWKAYNGLILNGYNHYRIHHSKNEFARGKNHINGIEAFWSYCKRRLAKFNGMNNNKLLLHLKECEFRWNYRNKNILQILLKIFKNK